MSPEAEPFTIGVEEEFQIIDPQTRQLCARAPLVLLAAQSVLTDTIVQLEFRQSQIETATPVCRSLSEVRSQILRLRSEVIAAAAQQGNQLAAAGTHPLSRWQEQPFTPKPRYLELADHYQRLMRELVTFGCHVHIGLSDRERAVQVMNRARVWLAPILALSGSSPFWLGSDTGYASYRTTLISRLPMAGPPLIFASYHEYEATVRSLVTTQTIQEASQICWDIRLSSRFPTLEFRVADMCMTVDEAVAIAGLVRGVVRTCYEQALSNTPYNTARPELILAANWHAARSGLDADLVDVDVEQCIPAQTLIEKLLEFVQPALETFGDWDEVYLNVSKILTNGNGAARQRQVYQHTHSLEAVVDFIVQETAQGVPSVSHVIEA